MRASAVARRQRFAVLGDFVDKADAERLLGADSSAGEDQVQRPAADQARQAHRAEVDQRHAEAAVKEAEDRRVRGDLRSPRGELQAARHRVALMAAITGLWSQPRRAHRSEVAVGLRRSPLALGHGLQVGAGAEAPPGP